MVVSADGARAAGRGQREQGRKAMQSAWSPRRPRVALLPNEAAARPPAEPVEQTFSPRVSGIGMHPWSESSYTASMAAEPGSAHLPGRRAPTLEPSSGIMLRAAVDSTRHCAASIVSENWD